MTFREMYSIIEQHGALDYEVLMNINLEPVPVRGCLAINDLQYGSIVFKNIIILDT